MANVCKMAAALTLTVTTQPAASQGIGITLVGASPYAGVSSR